MIVLRMVLVAALIYAGCNRPAPGDAAALLREADRLAWLTHWTAATPLFARAEASARDTGDTRNALYAKFGRLRGEMQIRPLPDVSAESRGTSRATWQRPIDGFVSGASRPRATSISNGMYPLRATRGNRYFSSRLI